MKHHGVHLLEKKQKKIEVFSNNLNDVRILLGPPSTKNSFDTDEILELIQTYKNKITTEEE